MINECGSWIWLRWRCCDAAMARATGGKIPTRPRKDSHSDPSGNRRARAEKGDDHAGQEGIYGTTMLRTLDPKIRQKRHISYIPEPRGGGWVIDSEFKTLQTGRLSTRKKGKVFSITGEWSFLRSTAPRAADDQDTLRRSRNDRYFEPLLILPLRENSDGGGAVRAR